MSDCTAEIQKPNLEMRFNTLKYRVKEKFTKSNYEKRFDIELEILRKQNKDEGTLLIEDFIPVIRRAIRVFSRQGHSGGSAPYYAEALSNTLKNVLLFKPLSQVTGHESEWSDDTGEGVFQNKRVSALFKDNKGAYYLDAIIWSGEEEWDTFSGTVEDIKSRQYVKFPFTPKTFYIDVIRTKVDDDSVGDRSYIYSIKDKKQLEEVFKYYLEEK